MKRAADIAALRDRLARLIAEPGPPGMRGIEQWRIAEQIAANTGELPTAVLRQATSDAVKILAREGRR